MPDTPPFRRVSIAGRRCRVSGDPTDSFFPHVAAHARGLLPLIAVAAAVLPPDGVAIDVGANIGLATLALAALLPAGQVLAAEPSPRSLAALRRTLLLNRLEARVTVAGVAVGSAPGQAAFHDAEHSAGSHLLAEAALAAGAASVLVPVTTLDALVAAQRLDRLDFIKVDVEGFETEVLDGARAVLARFRPVVFIEFNAWTLLCNRNANPRIVLEDWLARFPLAHRVVPGGPPEPVTPATALAFLHDHLVQRRCADDLVLSFDPAWLTRWQPKPGHRRTEN